MAWTLTLQSDTHTGVVELPRSSGGPRFALVSADDWPSTGWPMNIAILRGSSLLTMLTVTSRTGSTFYTDGAAVGYSDTDLIVGDVAVLVPPDPSDAAAALLASPVWTYAPLPT